ncbi:cyclic AMP-dependent transcription factor ATF-7-like [Carcharodon carcharias]|uniref:cyclic AMP-dependent transcription factor ATF-7-like n=1 Tax=Carcharodon carcharias TaxID=13397 RepID=UPI001B7F1C8B|nr:cyclic AMP-dependent transcription factor ATF-7-like [Carcharodon carcharias]
MGDDRPFVCGAPGCGQRFTNEDHLAVHRHKHEMTLKFGPARDGVIVADQTPTPTRFLKNCEEVGLFNELANPFEQEFKKADEEEGKKPPISLPLSHLSLSLSLPPSPSPVPPFPPVSFLRSQDSPSQPTPSSGGGRRRRVAEEDPDERRRRFLERNRAAASRCRQKRKVWVTSLEKKAEELSHMNVQLQNEVRLLRSEVAQLKQLLLAHKDCPITAIQKRTQEYIADDSPQEMSEPTGSPAAVIQRGTALGGGGGSAGGGSGSSGSARAAAEAVATSVLAQLASQRSELSAGSVHPHPQVIMAPQSQAAADR